VLSAVLVRRRWLFCVCSVSVFCGVRMMLIDLACLSFAYSMTCEKEFVPYDNTNLYCSDRYESSRVQSHIYIRPIDVA